MSDSEIPVIIRCLNDNEHLKMSDLIYIQQSTIHGLFLQLFILLDFPLFLCLRYHAKILPTPRMARISCRHHTSCHLLRTDTKVCGHARDDK